MSRVERKPSPQVKKSLFSDPIRIGIGFLLVVLGVGIGAWFFGGNPFQMPDDLLGYFANVFTESLSIFLTILVLDRLNQWRDNQATKKRLIREAGSRSNMLATAAIEWLRAESWLVGEEGLLKGAHLWAANLQNTDLQGANLQEAYLREADLSGASLQEVTLTNANLRRANLHAAQLGDANLAGADIRNADLSEAVFLRANLENAKLDHVNLAGANLQNAKLKGAELAQAIFDERTVLPDAKNTGRDATGKLIFTQYWSSKTDMRRYTDPSHPDFWQGE